MSPYFIRCKKSMSDSILNILKRNLCVCFRDLQARQIGSTFVRLSWLPPWNDGGRAEIKYIIRCDECYPPREYSTLTTNFTVNNLLPSARFTFRVYATNSVSRFFREISFSEISVHTTQQGWISSEKKFANHSFSFSWRLCSFTKEHDYSST